MIMFEGDPLLLLPLDNFIRILHNLAALDWLMGVEADDYISCCLFVSVIMGEVESVVTIDDDDDYGLLLHCLSQTNVHVDSALCLRKHLKFAW